MTMRGPGRGYAWIYLDGGATPVAKINLYKATAQPMVIAWSKTWATSGKHTVKVWVAGTAGKPRVDVDAFLTLP